MSRVQYARIDQIKPFLDRQTDLEYFNKLKESIRKYGVLQPITLKPISKRKKGKKGKRSKEKRWMWEHVNGHQRRRACEELGITEIPFIMRNASDEEQVAQFYIENELRTDLSAYEKAQLMQRDLGKLSIKEIAEKYDMTLRYVRQCIATLENASAPLESALKRGKICLDDARAIARLEKDDQPEVLEEVLNTGLRGKKVEVAVAASTKVTTRTKAVVSLQDRLKTAVKDWEAVKQEKDEVYKIYQLSVQPLIEILADFELRRAVKSARIKVNAFIQE